MEIEVLKNFVVLEGIDGAGTTTQLARAGAFLASRGKPHWLSCEPTSGEIGALIRKALSGEAKSSPIALAALFAADRAEHLWGREGIVERASRGETVVCDRYLFSSLAYQGMSCGDEVARAFNLAFPLPELLVFLDIDPVLSLKRIEGRGKREIYENEAFLGPVAAAYRRVIESYRGSGMRIESIDATLGPEEIASRITALLP